MGENLTIMSVARMAGVSKSTVSRVLNNEPTVKPKTREQVLRVIEESGYMPNEIARSLVRQRSNLVGLITPFQVTSFYRNEYFRDVLRGVNNVLKEQEYDVILSPGNGVELDAIKKFVKTYHVGGIILLYLIPDDPSICYLLDNKIPFVVIGASEGFDNICQISYDYRSAMFDIVDDFIRHGRKKIAFFPSNTGLSTVRDYIAGYAEALLSHKLSVESKYLVEHQDTIEDIKETISCFKKNNSMPDAIIVSGDAVCLDLLSYCKVEGIRIPDDLAVFSLENGPANEILEISSLDLDYIQMGTLASRMLLDMLKGGEPHQKCLAYKIYYRNSSGAK